MLRKLRVSTRVHVFLSFLATPLSQMTKLNIPKKTKLFVDQALRERENAKGKIHVFIGSREICYLL